jgi:hypothetical protein
MFDSLLPLNFTVTVLLMSFVSIVAVNILMRGTGLVLDARIRFGLKDTPRKDPFATAEEPVQWIRIISPTIGRVAGQVPAVDQPAARAARAAKGR